jgi:hypothetical protein
MLVDQRQRGDAIRADLLALGDLSQVQRVDLIDDLHMPRQQPFHEADRPGLQRLGQQRVVGVGDGRPRQLQRGPQHELMLVHQDPHQLGHSQSRVRVIELHRHRLRQVGDGAVLHHMPADQILQ